MAGTDARDPQSFREFEHHGWQNAAGTYHNYWQELTQQTVAPMLDALAMTTGSELLDVACGPGYVAAAAAKRGARTVGIDFSEVMVKTAPQEAQGFGVVLAAIESHGTLQVPLPPGQP